MNVRLLCLFIVGLSMRPLFADYIPPTFQEIAEGTTARMHDNPPDRDEKSALQCIGHLGTEKVAMKFEM